MKKFTVLLGLFILNIQISKTQIITTVAGDSNSGYAGDGGQATNAELFLPGAVASDNSSGFYIADQGNDVIRKVNSSGIITTIAGNGISGYSGDGLQATVAELNFINDVVLDKADNIYIADASNNRIRKVNTSGIISTIVGNGVQGYSGDGGQATLAELNDPTGLDVDSAGNIYIAEQYNLVIRKVNTSGIITTIAGNNTNNYTGDNGQATLAAIGVPTGVGVDLSGNVYIADNDHNVIRKVNTSGIITTFAGNGTQGYSGDGGQATLAEFYGPWDVKTDLAGNLYISDQGNYVIRKVSTSGVVTTYAGGGSHRGDGGPATAGQLLTIFGISVDKFNNLYIADNGDNRVRKVSPGSPSGFEEITQSDEETAKLFPNPNDGKFTVSLQGVSGKTQITVFNILGEQVYQSSLNTTNTQIDLSNEADGIYLYRVVTEIGNLVSEGRLSIQ